MNLTILNQTAVKIPKLFMVNWVNTVLKDLGARRIKVHAEDLTIVLVSSQKMRALNRQFRSKDYATDVLSFESFEPSSLGELIICLNVVKKQAKEHQMTFEQELAYMILHGMLHLLGYDHETSAADAKKMFKIQDDIFFNRFSI